MPSCTYGAQVTPGEPDWYYVTRSDIDTWFSGFPYLFLLWVYSWVGRGYSLPLLALLNPDVPAAVGWQQLVTSSLVGGRFNVVGTLADAMDQLIQYHVFRDHCQCLYPTPTESLITSGTTTSSGAWQFPIDYVDYSTYQYLRLRYRIVTPPSGNTITFYFVASNGDHWTDGATYIAYVGQPWSAPFGSWSTNAAVLRNVTYPRTTLKLISAVSGHPFTLEWELYGTPFATSPSTPASPGAVTTTGIPTVASPSGTTSDQLMTQLLVQQFELRQLQDLIRSGIIGGSGLLPTAGTVHAGLSGDDEFDCVSLQGVRVQLSGVSTSVDRWISHPDEYSGAGRISFHGPGGWTQNVEAAHLDQYIPCPIPGSTKVGYHFLGGVSATITEYPS